MTGHCEKDIQIKRRLRLAGLGAVILIALGAILTACWESGRDNALDNARELDIDSLQSRGKAHYVAGRLDSAIYYFSIIASKYDEEDSEEERMTSAHAYNDCGICYFMLGNYPRAYNAFLSASRLGNEDMKVMVNNNIASIYNYFNDGEKAQDYLVKAFDGSLKTKNYDALYSAGLNILNYSFDNDRWDRGREVYETLKSAGAPPTNFTHYVELTARGMDLYRRGEERAGIECFKEAANVSDSLLDGTRYRISSYYNVAQAFLQSDEPDSAIHYLTELVTLGDDIGQTETMTDNYELLARCYEAKGDKQRELDYRLKGLDIRDSVFSTKEYGKILDFQTAYEVDRIESKLAESEYRRKTRDIVLLFSGGMLVIALVFIIIIIRKNRKLRQTLSSLYEKARDASALQIPLKERVYDKEEAAAGSEPLHAEGQEEVAVKSQQLLDIDKARELQARI